MFRLWVPPFELAHFGVELWPAGGLAQAEGVPEQAWQPHSGGALLGLLWGKQQLRQQEVESTLVALHRTRQGREVKLG